MSEPLLSARALAKTYTMGRRALEVLRGVNLDVARGEFLALRGASGAGKSTLLHLIGGLDTPNAGEIHFAGQNLATFSEGELTFFRNHRVGFVFQAYHLLPELNALENVCLPARMARTSVAQAETRGRDLLARVGLQNRMEHKPYELSGGEQQRVAIARALMNDPVLLLADEPTGDLDAELAVDVMRLLGDIHAKGTTVVVATHDMDMVRDLGRRAIILKGGRLVEEHL